MGRKSPRGLFAARTLALLRQKFRWGFVWKTWVFMPPNGSALYKR